MLGHLGLNVPDLVAAKGYYDELVPFVGFEEFFTADDRFAYRPANGKRGTYLFFYPPPDRPEIKAARVGGGTVGDLARERQRVLSEIRRLNR